MPTAKKDIVKFACGANLALKDLTAKRGGNSRMVLQAMPTRCTKGTRMLQSKMATLCSCLPIEYLNTLKGPDLEVIANSRTSW